MFTSVKLPPHCVRVAIRGLLFWGSFRPPAPSFGAENLPLDPLEGADSGPVVAEELEDLEGKMDPVEARENELFIHSVYRGDLRGSRKVGSLGRQVNLCFSLRSSIHAV